MKDCLEWEGSAKAGPALPCYIVECCTVLCPPDLRKWHLCTSTVYTLHLYLQILAGVPLFPPAGGGGMVCFAALHFSILQRKIQSGILGSFQSSLTGHFKLCFPLFTAMTQACLFSCPF